MTTAQTLAVAEELCAAVGLPMQVMVAREYAWPLSGADIGRYWEFVSTAQERGYRVSLRTDTIESTLTVTVRRGGIK